MQRKGVFVYGHIYMQIKDTIGAQMVFNLLKLWRKRNKICRLRLNDIKIINLNFFSKQATHTMYKDPNNTIHACNLNDHFMSGWHVQMILQ